MQFKLKNAGCYIVAETKIEAPAGDWRYERPVIKASKCSRCGRCSFFCPNGSMAFKDGCFEPNLDFCKGCGICANICPVNAVFMIREE